MRGKQKTDWRDRPCWRCGYPLRHLPAGDIRNCPECGLAIRISLSGSRSLAMANPKWLAWQSLGCNLAAFGLMSGAGGAMTMFARATLALHGVSPIWTGVFMIEAATTSLLSAGWILAIPDPNLSPTDGRWRLVRRILVNVLLGGIAALILIGVLHFAQPAILFLILVPWGSVFLITAGGMTRHPQRLIERAQHRPTRRLLRIAKWMCILGAAWPFFGGFGFVVLLPRNSHDRALAWLMISMVAILALLVGALWAWVAAQVRHDRKAALLTWTSD